MRFLVAFDDSHYNISLSGSPWLLLIYHVATTSRRFAVVFPRQIRTIADQNLTAYSFLVIWGESTLLLPLLVAVVLVYDTNINKVSSRSTAND